MGRFLRRFGQNVFDGFFKFETVQGHFAETLRACDPDIAPDPQDPEHGAAAGMYFFHFDQVSDAEANHSLHRNSVCREIKIVRLFNYKSSRAQSQGLAAKPRDAETDFPDE